MGELTALPRPPSWQGGEYPPISALRASLFGPLRLAISVDPRNVVDGLPWSSISPN